MTRKHESLLPAKVHETAWTPAKCRWTNSTPRFSAKRRVYSAFSMNNCTLQDPPSHPGSTPPQLSSQNLFLVGSGLGLFVILLSSLPLSLNHFFVPNSNSRSNSALGSFLCMKLQNPPLTHPSPLLSRQHASLKSVTGESSQ